MFRPLLSCLLITSCCASEATVTATSLGGRPMLAVRAPASDAINPQVAARLRLPLNVDWNEISVAEACEQLASRLAIPLVVDPDLRASPSLPVTLQVTNMRGDRVLEWVARLGDVVVTPTNGCLYVSREAPERPNSLRLYDVSDLVHQPRHFAGPTISIHQPGANGAIIGLPEDESVERMDVDELAEVVNEMINR
ncbi:MAG: hypothetical protein PF961_12745 [Planctomycetota bacterium]|jgi:hypothetical protein|nr:hypothetical protein [Planctomycetota bacterium]